MLQRQHTLRSALLTVGLLAGTLLNAPAHAAGGLDRLTRGVIAPGDISGAIVFGKNGEVIPLDAKGKPLSPCVMSHGTAPGAKKSKLAECQSGSASEANGPKPKAAGVPCEGYYLIWIGGYPVKIWFPVGCTPP
mgnify:CR=1 FL=1